MDPNAYDEVLEAAGLIGAGPYSIVGKACARIYIRAANELVPGYVGPPADANEAARDLGKDPAKDPRFGALGPPAWCPGC